MEESLAGHRTHLGSGALSASGNHPDQDTWGHRSGNHPAPSDVVARRSRNGERSCDPGSSQPTPERIAPFASHDLSHSQPSVSERGFTVRYIV